MCGTDRGDDIDASDVKGKVGEEINRPAPPARDEDADISGRMSRRGSRRGSVNDLAASFVEIFINDNEAARSYAVGLTLWTILLTMFVIAYGCVSIFGLNSLVTSAFDANATYREEIIDGSPLGIEFAAKSNATHIVYTPLVFSDDWHNFTSYREDLLGDFVTTRHTLTSIFSYIAVFCVLQIVYIYGGGSKFSSSVFFLSSMFQTYIYYQSDSLFLEGEITYQEFLDMSQLGTLGIISGILVGWGYLNWREKEPYLLLKVLGSVIFMYPALMVWLRFGEVVVWMQRQEFLAQLFFKTVVMTALKEYILFVQVTWASSLKKANHRYTFLLVCIHSTQMPFMARFLQLMSQSTGDVLITEIVLLALELFETKELLNGLTIVDWTLKRSKVFWRKCVAKSSAIASDESVKAETQTEVDRKYKTREHLFGAIVITNTIAEIAAIVTSALAIGMLKFRDINGDAYEMNTLVMNTLIVLFFEVILSEWLISFWASRQTKRVLKQDNIGTAAVALTKVREPFPTPLPEGGETHGNSVVRIMKQRTSFIQSAATGRTSFVQGKKTKFIVDLSRVWRDLDKKAFMVWFFGFLVMVMTSFTRVLNDAGCSVRIVEEAGDGFEVVEGFEPWMAFCKK